MRPLLTLIALLALAAPAAAKPAPPTWPPKDGPGLLVAHYGEEHWNDKDGREILTRVVADVSRYAPVLVTMSGDKASNGTVEQLVPWLEIMRPYDDAGIPWLAGVGNHDRDVGFGEDTPETLDGTSPAGDLSKYEQVFAGRPYPMGDAKPYDRPGFAPAARPGDDPEGAASHYYVDVPGLRVVFLDNSCQSISNCDLLQNPPDGKGLGQFDYLRARGREAAEQGRQLFVVMHQPTRDPGDQSYRKDTAKFHVMAKGLTPDNALFESVAVEAGVDAVFLAHIKGQFQYRGAGDVPYFIDGGAGGELYTTGPVGTDHGYWHGYRLVRVHDGRWTTDAVPIFTPGSLRITGPDALARGEAATFEGFGSQPVKNHEAKVDALEIRDPAPQPRSGSGLGWIWLGAPLAALLLAALAGRPRPVRRAATAGVALAVGAAGFATAQQSEPTDTPAYALPNPARIWTSANPQVLAPVASEDDDGRRNPRTQTSDGRFTARCPGRARVWLSSGWETAEKRVTVPSAPGPVAERLKVRRKRAVVRLAQPAVVRVRRGKRRVSKRCLPAGRHVLRFKRATARKRVAVTVLSDRQPLTRRR